MNWLGHFDAEKFLLFTLVLTRLSGLMLIAPIYGTRDVPAQVRVLLAFALAVLIMPTQWHVVVTYPQSTPLYLVFVASELLIGLCLGLAVVILSSGMELAGELIGYVSGLMLAEVFDPNMEGNVPLFSRLLFLLTTAVFVGVGGHRMVMAGLLDTFQSIPPGSAAFPTSIAETLVVLVTQSFHLAIRAAVPVVAALLLATLVLGLISRTLPQLNVLALGFGINAMLTFAVLSLTLGAAVWAYQAELQPALEIMLDALHAPLQAHWLGQ